jgi:hypothetical protein
MNKQAPADPRERRGFLTEKKKERTRRNLMTGEFGIVFLRPEVIIESRK